MTSDAWFLVLSIVLWVAIVAWWTWWIRGRLRRRRWIRTWPRAQAHVTEAWATNESVTAQDQTTRYRLFHGSYEFTDPTGTTHRGKHTASAPLVEGDRLEVMYDPDEPSTHETVTEVGKLWAKLVLFGFLTLGVGMFAVITLFLGLGYD